MQRSEVGNGKKQSLGQRWHEMADSRGSLRWQWLHYDVYWTEGSDERLEKEKEKNAAVLWSLAVAY